MLIIDVTTKSKKWLQEKDVENFIEKTCQKIIPLTDLKKILAKDFTLEIAVSLVSDSEIKKINSHFRKKNKPTDVLSFSNLDEKLINKVGIVKAVGSAKYLLLGDIVISYETVKKESLAQKKNFRNHLSHLLLHSILHLIGHDHEQEKAAKKMENLEIKILKKLKIKNPYK
jgi:probable rRNA maturation factor